MKIEHLLKSNQKCCRWNSRAGIDLTQSPGRDSPGSSSGSGSGSRHSTASLDSGRASSYHTSSSVASKPSYQPFSNQVPPFSNNSGILSSPRCSSVSSCSIGSADMHRTDHEIICDWLRELSMEEYAPLFSEAGYDMPTISRMTPEDLTAIGIKKPRHRERIKQHIDSLQLPDNLPHYVPVSESTFFFSLFLLFFYFALLLNDRIYLWIECDLIWLSACGIGFDRRMVAFIATGWIYSAIISSRLSTSARCDTVAMGRYGRYWHR